MTNPETTTAAPQAATTMVAATTMAAATTVAGATDANTTPGGEAGTTMSGGQDMTTTLNQATTGDSQTMAATDSAMKQPSMCHYNV